MKKKIIRSVVFGLLALLGSAVALVLFQMCFVESFWLHAVVFPINPQTVSQPTALTYIGTICQILFPALLVVGAVFLLRAAWLFACSRKRNAA